MKRDSPFRQIHVSRLGGQGADKGATLDGLCVFTYCSSMSTPLATLTVTGDPLIVECSFCALTRVMEPLAALVAFGEAATFADVEAQPCPRCGIRNDRTRWQRAKAATAEDLLGAAPEAAVGEQVGRRGRRLRHRRRLSGRVIFRRAKCSALRLGGRNRASRAGSVHSGFAGGVVWRGRMAFSVVGRSCRAAR